MIPDQVRGRLRANFYQIPARHIRVYGAGADEALVWYEGGTTTLTLSQALQANHQGSVIAVTNQTVVTR